MRLEKRAESLPISDQNHLRIGLQRQACDGHNDLLWTMVTTHGVYGDPGHRADPP
jgi:hypothetical protein